MNIETYLKKQMKNNFLNNLDVEEREFGLILLAMKGASDIFYRDYEFFLNKENEENRRKIYNNNIDIFEKDINEQDLEVVCKSYCRILRQFLVKNYNLNIKEISSDNDDLKHIDFLFTNISGKKYIINPFQNIMHMQEGINLVKFADKEVYEGRYQKKYDNISFLEKEKLSDILKKLNIDLETNQVRINKISDKFLSIDKKVSEKTILKKLKFMSEEFLSKSKSNGAVEFIQYSSYLMGKFFNKNEKSKVKANRFFINENDIEDDSLKDIFSNQKNSIKRGIIYETDSNVMIQPMKNNSKFYDKKTWEDLQNKNKFKITKEYKPAILKLLKKDSRVIKLFNNNEFRRYICKIEEFAELKGIKLKELIENYTEIDDGYLGIGIGKNKLGFKITKNGELDIYKDTNKIKRVIIKKEGTEKEKIYNR